MLIALLLFWILGIPVIIVGTLYCARRRVRSASRLTAPGEIRRSVSPEPSGLAPLRRTGAAGL
jgi:hypothetical protein